MEWSENWTYLITNTALSMRFGRWQMLALKREERYIVHQVSSDMNLTETRLRNSIDSIPAMGWCSFTEVAFKLPNDIHSS